MTAVYYSMGAWAQKIGRSKERVRQLIELGRVPTAIKIIGTIGNETWAIPIDTTLPPRVFSPGRKNLLALEPPLPDGWISVRRWAFLNNKTMYAARIHQDAGKIQTEIIRGLSCIKEGTPWPCKKYEKRNKPKPRIPCPYCNRTMSKIRVLAHIAKFHPNKV